MKWSTYNERERSRRYGTAKRDGLNKGDDEINELKILNENNLESRFLNGRCSDARTTSRDDRDSFARRPTS